MNQIYERMRKIKNTRKIFITILFVVLCFSGFVTSYAMDAKSGTETNFEQLNHQIPLAQFITSEGEDTVEVELYKEEPQTRSFELVNVGKARFRIYYDGILDAFEGQWSITLENGDKIKGVSGKLIVKKDNLGPLNTTLATLYANAWYSYGTLFANSEGVTEMDRENDDVSLNYNTDIILQWRDFVVTGVEDRYLVRNGERQGTISKLSMYPTRIGEANFN